MRRLLFSIVSRAGLALGLLLVTQVSTATLLELKDGQLVGARYVEVGGSYYDVDFLDGNCTQSYGGCSPQNFDFDNAADSRLAAQSLLDQVLIDTAFGNFDSTPNLTFGCQLASANCFNSIAYGTSADGRVLKAQGVNVNDAGRDDFVSLGSDAPGISRPNSNYVRFTEITTELILNNGRLIGAKNVFFLDEVWDVSFVDGNCIVSFEGDCSETAFDFETAGDATAAAQSLLDQVLIDGDSGSFDSTPNLTEGCQLGSANCFNSVAYGISGNGSVLSAKAVNVDSFGRDDFIQLGSDAPGISRPNANYVRFTQKISKGVVEVPTPGTMFLFLSGLGILLVRRKTILKPS